MGASSEQKILLDFCRDTYKTVNVKQFDQNSRTLIFECYNNGNFVTLDALTMIAYFKMYTPDNRPIYDKCTISDGCAKITLSENALASGGIAQAELVIANTITNDNEDEEITTSIISTMKFQINIKDSVYGNDAVVGEPEFDALNDLIIEASQVVSEENIRKANEVARQEAELERETNTATAISNTNEAIANAVTATNNVISAINDTEAAINSATSATESANTAAENADQAREDLFTLYQEYGNSIVIGEEPSEKVNTLVWIED